MSLIDDAKEAYADEENQADAAQAAAYYEKAEKCISDRGNCDEILVQAGAEYVGVDPTTAQLVYECAEERDTDTCSKAGVTIGAIAACTYFSAGQTVLCGKAVPFVVNLIWPVLGPFVTGAVGVVTSFIGGAMGVAEDVVNHVWNMLGKGGDGKSLSEIHREWAAAFIIPTKKAIASAMLDGVNAISAADYSITDMVDIHGSVGALPIKKVFDIAAIQYKSIKNIRHSHLSLLNKHVGNSEKAIKDVYVLWNPMQYNLPSGVQYVISRSKPTVQKHQMLLSMTTHHPEHKMSMAELETMAETGESVWHPVSYSIERGKNVPNPFVPFNIFAVGTDPKKMTSEFQYRRSILKQEYEAFVKATEWRMSGIVESMNGAVGEQVSLKMSAPKESEESSGSSWLLWTGLIGAGALAYVYRKKLFK